MNGPDSARAEHQLAADPTSVALLLADPATAGLWPGMEPVRPELDHDAVVVRLRGEDARLEVGAPERSATGYQLEFALRAADRTTHGRLRLRPSGARTDASLELDERPELADDARTFLRRLAAAAEARSTAA